MSINDATPQDWDKVRVTGEPTFEEYMKRLDSKFVYDSTENYGTEVTADAEDFKGCWSEPLGLELGNDEWLEYPSVGKTDPVNAPIHYNTGSVECIEAIKASMSDTEFKGYLKGNAMKYLWRYDYKGKPVEDLKKAQWYLSRLTEEVE